MHVHVHVYVHAVLVSIVYTVATKPLTPPTVPPKNDSLPPMILDQTNGWYILGSPTPLHSLHTVSLTLSHPHNLHQVRDNTSCSRVPGSYTLFLHIVHCICMCTVHDAYCNSLFFFFFVIEKILSLRYLQKIFHPKNFNISIFSTRKNLHFITKIQNNGILV